MNHLSAFIWHYLHSVKSMPDFLCHDPGTNLLPDSFCFWAKQKLTLRRFGCRLSSYCIFFCCGTCDCFLRIVSKHVALLCKSYRSNVSVCVFLTIQGLCWSSDVYTGCVCVCLLQYLSFPVKRAFARNGCFASWFSLPGKCLSNYPNNDPFQISGKTR